MYAKFHVNRETADNFMRLFMNRRAYAIQGERALPNGSVPYYPARNWKTKETKPLDVPYSNFIADSAQAQGVAPELVASVIAVESNFNPNAVSWRSARGLMQLMPQTAAKFGVTNIFDPRQNIDAGTKYLKELLLRYNGDLALALAAYNAGPDRVEQYRSVPPYRETRDYVRRVTEKFRKTYQASALTVSLQ